MNIRCSKKLKYCFSIFIAIYSISACTEKNKDQKQKPPATVDVLLAKKMNFSAPIEVNGTVLSEEMVELHSETSGKIIYLNMPDGENIPAGTLLVKINDAELKAQLAQQKAQLNIAVKNEQSLKKLLEINGVTQLEYDAAISQVNSYKASIQVLEAQIEKTLIKAPFNGKLGLRTISLGAYVTPQTLIGTLQQSDKTKIDFSIPEAYTNYVKPGDLVKIKTNDSETIYDAVVQAKEPTTDAETRNVKVRARLKNGLLTPGTFVKVLISQTQNGILIPSNAIIPDANSNQVIVLKNGETQFVDVETGNRNENNIIILKGIDEGDSVIVSGVLFVRPKAKVKVRKTFESLENIK